MSFEIAETLPTVPSPKADKSFLISKKTNQRLASIRKARKLSFPTMIGNLKVFIYGFPFT